MNVEAAFGGSGEGKKGRGKNGELYACVKMPHETHCFVSVIYTNNKELRER